MNILAFAERKLELPDIKEKFVGLDSPYGKFDLGIWFKDGFIKVYTEDKGISPLTIEEVNMKS